MSVLKEGHNKYLKWAKTALLLHALPCDADCEASRENEEHSGDGGCAGQGEGGVLRIGGGGPRQAEGHGHAENGWKKRNGKHFGFITQKTVRFSILHLMYV